MPFQKSNPVLPACVMELWAGGRPHQCCPLFGPLPFTVTCSWGQVGPTEGLPPGRTLCLRGSQPETIATSTHSGPLAMSPLRMRGVRCAGTVPRESQTSMGPRGALSLAGLVTREMRGPHTERLGCSG